MTEHFEVGVSIDTKEAVRGAREFKRSADDTAASMEKLGNAGNRTSQALGGMSGSAGLLRRALWGIGIGSIAGLFGVAAQSAIQFSGAMARVSTLIKGDTTTQMKALTDEVLRMSRAYGMAPTAQAAALYEVISAGIEDTAQAVKILDAANKLAIGGVTDVQTAADGLTSLLQAYSLSAEHATEVSDAMFQSAADGKTTIEELSRSVGLVGATAANVGVPIDQLLASIGALTKVGVTTSQAIIGIRQALSNILKPTKMASEAAARLGVELSAEALQRAGGLAGYMKLLAEKAEGSTQKLVDVFQSVQAVNVVMALAGNGAQAFADGLERMKDKAGNTEEALEKMNASAERQAIILKNNLGMELLSVGNQMLKVIGPAIKFLNENFDTMMRVIRAVVVVGGTFLALFRGLPAILAAATAAQARFVAMVAAANAQLVVMGKNLKSAAESVAIFSMITGRTAVVVGVLTTAARGLLALLGGPLGIAILLATAVISMNAFSESAVDAREKVYGLVDGFQELTLDLGLMDEASGKAAVSMAKLHMQETLVEIGNTKVKIEELTAALKEMYPGIKNVDELANKSPSLMALQGSLATLYATWDALNQKVLEGVQVGNMYLHQAAQEVTETAARTARLSPLIEQYGKLSAAQLKRIQLENDLAEAVKRGETSQAVAQQVLKNYDAAIRSAEKAIEDLIKRTEDQQKAWQDIVKQTDPAAAIMIEYGEAVYKLAQSFTEAELAAGGLVEIQQVLLKQAQQNIRALGTREDRIRALKGQFDPLVAVEDKYAKLIEKLNAEFPENLRNTKEYLDLLQALTAAKDEDIRKIQENGQESKAWEKLWKEAITRVDELFVDLWASAFEGFDDFVDSMVNTFKRMLAEMAHAAITRPIVVAIQGMFMGGGGMAAGAAGAAGSSGVSGAVGGMLGGSGGGLGGYAGMAASLWGGQSLLAGLGSGASMFLSGAGAYSGGQLGALLGSGSSYGVGAAGGQLLAGGGLGFLAGTGIDALLGGRGQYNDILATVGGMIGSIWGPLGALIGGAVGSLVSNLIGGAKKTIDAGLEIAIEEGEVSIREYKRIAKKKAFFGGTKKYFKYKEASDEIVQGIQDIFDQSLEALQGIAEMLGVNGDAFKNFSMPATNLSFKGLSEEEAKAKLEEFVFGAIADQIEKFIDHTKGLSDLLKTVVKAYKGNAKEMIEVFQIMAGIEKLFDTDPIKQAHKDFVNRNKTVMDIYHEQVEALREVIANTDNSIDSLRELAQATAAVRQSQYELALAYEAVSEQSKQMFGDTIQQIRESLMTDEELYNTRQRQIDRLVAELSQTTDPLEMQRIIEQINALALDAFNMLTPEQQAAMGPEIIEFLRQVNDLLQQQVDEGQSNLDTDVQELQKEVSEALLKAAETQQAAADALLAAADRLDDAARRLGGNGGGGRRRREIMP